MENNKIIDNSDNIEKDFIALKRTLNNLNEKIVEKIIKLNEEGLKEGSNLGEAWKQGSFLRKDIIANTVNIISRENDYEKIDYAIENLIVNLLFSLDQDKGESLNYELRLKSEKVRFLDARFDESREERSWITQKKLTPLVERIIKEPTLTNIKLFKFLKSPIDTIFKEIESNHIDYPIHMQEFQVLCMLKNLVEELRFFGSNNLFDDLVTLLLNLTQKSTYLCIPLWFAPSMFGLGFRLGCFSLNNKELSYKIGMREVKDGSRLELYCTEKINDDVIVTLSLPSELRSKINSINEDVTSPFETKFATYTEVALELQHMTIQIIKDYKRQKRKKEKENSSGCSVCKSKFSKPKGWEGHRTCPACKELGEYLSTAKGKPYENTRTELKRKESIKAKQGYCKRIVTRYNCDRNIVAKLFKEAFKEELY